MVTFPLFSIHANWDPINNVSDLGDAIEIIYQLVEKMDYQWRGSNQR